MATNSKHSTLVMMFPAQRGASRLFAPLVAELRLKGGGRPGFLIWTSGQIRHQQLRVHNPGSEKHGMHDYPLKGITSIRGLVNRQ